MARAIRRETGKRRAHAVLGEGLPLGLAGDEGRFLADQQAGFLVGFGELPTARWRGARKAGAASACGELRLFVRVQA